MKKVSILFVANSFGDDTIMYMSRIAKEFGIELDAHILYIDGCDINTHSDMLQPLIEVGASRSRILLNPVSTSYLAMSLPLIYQVLCLGY